jgi:hypothetical protein
LSGVPYQFSADGSEHFRIPGSQKIESEVDHFSVHRRCLFQQASKSQGRYVIANDRDPNSRSIRIRNTVD